MTDLATPGLALPRADAPAALRVGEVFGQSFGAFSAHWTAYCGVMAIGYAPFSLLIKALNSGKLILGQDLASGLLAVVAIAALVVSTLCLTLAPAIISLGVAQDLSGGDLSLGESAWIVLRRSPAIIGATALIVLCVLFGLILLIVPGMIVLCVYAIAIPACAVERVGPIKSMSRSAFLTRGNRWRVFEVLFLYYLCSVSAERLLEYLASRILDATVSLAVTLPFNIAIDTFGAVLTFVLYRQLRIAREGADAEEIARVFD